MSSKEDKKTDWGKLRQEFLSEQKKTGISANEFFKKSNVNANTGRKNFNALAKGIASSSNTKKAVSNTVKPVKSVTKADPKTEGSTKQKPAKKRDQREGSTLKGSTKRDQGINSKAAKNKGLATGSLTKDKTARVKVPEKAKRLTILKPERFRDRSSDQQILHSGKFTKGNAAAARHGGYLNLAAIDSDIVEAVRANPINDVNSLNELFEARLVFMSRLLDERVTDLVTLSNEGYVFKDEEGEIESLSDKIRDSYWRSIPCMSNLYGVVTNNKINAAKAIAEIDLKEFKLFREQSDREMLVQIVSEAYENEELSSLDAVKMIERAGLKAPALLAREAMKEIELMAPAVDNSGVTDKEIEDLLAHQQESLSGQIALLTERRLKLQELMAESRAEYELGTVEEMDFNHNDDSTNDDDFTPNSTNSDDFEDGDVLLENTDEWD